MNLEFPQYRKLSNGKSYYKIIASDELEELQIIGRRYALHTLKAKILPERNLLADLLDASTEQYTKIVAKEYDDMLGYCQRVLELVRI